jgi:hypothetical protein
MAYPWEWSKVSRTRDGVSNGIETNIIMTGFSQLVNNIDIFIPSFVRRIDWKAEMIMAIILL